MVENTKMIKVLNRDNGSVGYTIPDLNNLHRNFEPKEEKTLTMEELRKLSYIPGGEYILENCLLIKDEEAVEELLGSVEPEYYYTTKEIEYLLTQGSEEQFLDCLDFAPSGVIDIIKDTAVRLKVNDINKRQAILNKTGFNVTKAVEINAETEDEREPEAKSTRRAAAVTNVKETVKEEQKESGFRRATPINK